MPVIYTQSKLFLFPAINARVGIPLVGAMRCECPVITSNDTACGEIGGDAACLVSPDSVDAIRDAIEQLVNNEELRITYRRKGRKRSEQFDWRLSAEHTHSITHTTI